MNMQNTRHRHVHHQDNAIHCGDFLSLVAFSAKAELLSPFRGAFDPSFAKAVISLPDVARRGGATNMTAGLRIALDQLERVPTRLFRKVYLLADGNDNEEYQLLPAEIDRAVRMKVRVNTIAFGNSGCFDPARLQLIADKTGGRCIPVESAQQLGKLLHPGPRKIISNRGEATVYCIDTSYSMNERMGASTKIEIVRDTMLSLVRYKQNFWS